MLKLQVDSLYLLLYVALTMKGGPPRGDPRATSNLWNLTAKMSGATDVTVVMSNSQNTMKFLQRYRKTQNENFKRMIKRISYGS